MLRNVHENDGLEHFGCPDPFCCECECRVCKRAWFALDRPRSVDCPKHGSQSPAKGSPS